ncbi:fasciclin domain-containing protein [Dyadobacter jejuensis]|uniref:Fasciclin domain-containing protein n=1 Tax=Dyadobacter jejuensis TaxID=1082580 RepID=A0A316AHE2_9BACT|nr:fasciclin domain-containing protein [Dyadobacter jejuensis]PWJ57051.1 fasciclin domain-containing protein [Dyadobacter jejuensis]
MKRSIITMVLATVLFSFGCSDEYFTDGGVQADLTGTLNVSTMDYLQSEPAKFDTLVSLIKLCGLETEISTPGSTFLAPQDYSIHNFFKLLYPDETKWPALTDLSEEEKSAITQILRNYIIPDQEIERSGLSPAYSYATTQGGKTARFNLIRTDYIGNVNMGAAFIVFALDVSPEGSSVERFQSVTVVTSGLRSTNGMIHILDPNTHIFGFN